MNINNIRAYELIEKKEIKDLNSVGYLMKHKKSGARVVVLENDDENKVFSIGFRTPPTDSTGCPHIMEHSVLCGSKKFPAKDPFVELAKGSLNTFLNAMTFPDKTLYPVASCNNKDFRNLMHVYLDAVFYPNIYTKEEIFKQEGWHYELASKNEEITINGVVYNEMKGAFSSPDSLLDRVIFDNLFPDSCYGVESGGDPDCIPDLTYEKFLDFHKKYYHPSNSFIYLYGDADMESELNFIDAEYLCDFEYKEIDSKIGYQKPFDKTLEVTKSYPITNDEPLEDNTYLSYTVALDTVLDRELYLAFDIVEYALLAAPGAVLKKALLDKGIGKDIQSSYENGILQPYMSIIAKNANASDKEVFMDTINEVLEDVVKNGFDKDTLRGAININEFRYREADYFFYPKGLMYCMISMDSWLYDDSEPFMHIAQNDTYSFLRKMVDTDYFEKLVEKYLLSNPHSCFTVLEPKRGLTVENDAKLREKLKEYKATLSKDEITKLVEDTKHLHEYQESGDDEETLKKLPLLELSDIKKEAMPFSNTVIEREGYKILSHDLFTNGIGYLTLAFDAESVSEDLIPYVGLLKSILGYVDTKDYGYSELNSAINLETGGVHSFAAVYKSKDAFEKSYRCIYEVGAKFLYNKLEAALDLIRQIIFTSDFSDRKRIKEIVLMCKSRIQTNLVEAGHVTAAHRALSNISESEKVNELLSGIDYYRFLEKLEADFDNCYEALVENLKACVQAIFNKESLIVVDYTALIDETKSSYELIDKFVSELPSLELEKKKWSLDTCGKNEAYKTSAKVNYVAKAGIINEKIKSKGALNVLKVIMGYDYLWNQVRVVGGAYGCSENISRDGDGFFTSFRDPNLSRTLKVYEDSIDYLSSFEADERTMTKYIIGTMSNVDMPLSPMTKGVRSFAAYLKNQSFEEVQRERDEILKCTGEDIRQLAVSLKDFMNNSAICVIGSEEAIEESKELFDFTGPLINN